MAQVWFGRGALLLGCYSHALAQTDIQRFDGGAGGDRFAASVAAIVDVSGDGIPELIIGCGSVPNVNPGGGYVRVYSGSALLRSLSGASTRDGFGVSVLGSPDLDGDGWLDVLVGAPYTDFGSRTDSGSVYCYSLQSGSLLWRLDGVSTGDQFGSVLASAGDVDGDGILDALVGAPSADAGGLNSGSAYVLAGADQGALFEFRGAPGDALGAVVAGGADLDGDGTPDFVIGSKVREYVNAYSGSTGALIFSKSNVGAGFPSSIAILDDVDGDGGCDVGVGSVAGSGMVEVVSGRTGATIWSAAGDLNGDSLGYSLAKLGDLDGDGICEVGSGATFGALDGMARIFSGAAGRVIGSIEVSEFLHTPGSAGGVALANAGDADGDGVEDIIVGADGSNDGSLTAPGSVLVISGASCVSTRPLFVAGGAIGSSFGSACDVVPDVDGDGVSDILATTPSGNSAQISSGVDGQLIRLLAPQATDSNFGARCGLADDLDGDGNQEVWVGSPGPGNGASPGTVRIFSGSSGSLFASLVGTSGGDGFGTSVSCSQDVDGDGIRDFFVGADLSGYVQVFSGATRALLLTIVGSSNTHFGAAVDMVRDLNGDGEAELVVGAWTDSGTGSVFVYSGASGQLIRASYGDTSQDHFGFAVAGIDDVNGDGLSDIVVGAILDDHPGYGTNTQWGRIRVISGAFVATGASPEFLYSVWGNSFGDRFGSTVARLGDVDVDGVTDFVVGAPLDDHFGMDSGSAYVCSGVDGSVLHALRGRAMRGLFGTGLSRAVDLDGDGVPEVVVGAPTEVLSNGAVHVFSLGGCTSGGYVEYGFGTVGSGGYVPNLFGTGWPTPGAPTVVSLNRALGGTPTLLCIGVFEASIPLYGGSLQLIPFIFISQVTFGPTNIAGAGWVNERIDLPSDSSLIGLDVLFQTLVLDPKATQKICLSNPLKMAIR